MENTPIPAMIGGCVSRMKELLQWMKMAKSPTNGITTNVVNVFITFLLWELYLLTGACALTPNLLVTGMRCLSIMGVMNMWEQIAGLRPSNLQNRFL
jgi:hypothetical protein